MEKNEKVLKNFVSFLSETKLIDKFKANFMDVVKRNESFNDKLEALMESVEKPEDEMLWKRIISAEENFLTKEENEILFAMFQDTLERILPK